MRQLWQRPQTNKMAEQSPNTIEALEEILGLLRITEDNISNRSIEPAIPETEKMSTAPVLAVYNKNVQITTPKSMVSDLGQFDGDRTKFEDWQRGIQLFLKSNRVVATDNKITAVLAWLKGGVVGIYTQKKINELENIGNTQDWKEFIKEIKTACSDKSKAANAEWKIEIF